MNREDVDIRVEMLKKFPENYSLTKIEDDDKDNRLGGDGSIYEKNRNSYIYEKTREMDKKNYKKMVLHGLILYGLLVNLIIIL